MKKSIFSAAQIAGIFKEFDQGKAAEEITRQYEVSKAACIINQSRWAHYGTSQKSWLKKTLWRVFGKAAAAFAGRG